MTLKSLKMVSVYRHDVSNLVNLVKLDEIMAQEMFSIAAICTTRNCEISIIGKFFPFFFFKDTGHYW